MKGHPPLALTLTGSCVSQPSDSVHLLSFKSRARVAAAQSVSLENPTDKNWFITPVLKGEHWQGAGQLQVRCDSNFTSIGMLFKDSRFYVTVLLTADVGRDGVLSPRLLPHPHHKRFFLFCGGLILVVPDTR